MRDELFKNRVADLEQLTEAWQRNPRLLPDGFKKQFLEELPMWAEQLGPDNCVQHLLPCVIECFNSDETVHPDIYDQYAPLLFSSLTEVIGQLSKAGLRILLQEVHFQYFESERYEEQLRDQVLEKVVAQVVEIARRLGEDGRLQVAEIVTQCLQDDGDEWRRLVGIRLADELCQSLG